MATRHFTLTLTGAVQRLSSVLADPTPGGIRDEAYRFLSLQPDKANTNDVFVGSTSAMTTSDYGLRLDPTDTQVPTEIMGHYDAGPVKLSEIYVIGTNAEKLHIWGVPF